MPKGIKQIEVYVVEGDTEQELLVEFSWQHMQDDGNYFNESYDIWKFEDFKVVSINGNKVDVYPITGTLEKYIMAQIEDMPIDEFY